MFEVKKTQCGQYRSYGDFFREWDIITEESMEATLKYCFTELYKVKTPLPKKEEFYLNIKCRDEHFDFMDYYFRGYYDIIKIEGGYHFTICEPYAD